MKLRLVLPFLLAGGMVLLLLSEARMSDARVGGGQSYSSSTGSSSSSSGSSGHFGSGSSGGSLAAAGAFLLVMLVLFVGIALLAPTILRAMTPLLDQRRGLSPSNVQRASEPLFVQILTKILLDLQRRSSSSIGAFESPHRSGGAVDTGLGRLRSTDPNFSVHLFLDFAQLLYVRIREAVGSGQLERLGAYLASDVLSALQTEHAETKGLAAIRDVIVGTSHIAGVHLYTSGFATIEVDFESNFAMFVRDKDGHERRKDLESHERWTFRKARDVPSKPPEAITLLNCPSCGAPGEQTLQGDCRHCGQVVNNGRFNWIVSALEVRTRTDKQPIQAGGGGEEAGTGLATIVDPGLTEALATLRSADSRFSQQEFEQHVRKTFLDLQSAWTEMKWDRARTFETDHLFETHRFWIERYRESGLNNRIEDVTISNVVLAKVQQDAYFDAITVRIFASGLDYTQDRSGRLVDGSNQRKRSFSEYWTFIRRRAGQRREVADPRTPGAGFSCPGCGAPIEVGQAGVCGYLRGEGRLGRVRLGRFADRAGRGVRGMTDESSAPEPRARAASRRRHPASMTQGPRKPSRRSPPSPAPRPHKASQAQAAGRAAAARAQA